MSKHITLLFLLLLSFAVSPLHAELNNASRFSSLGEVRQRRAGVRATDAPNIPSVQITSPPDGSIFTAPATVTVTAAASAPVGTIERVEFFANGVLVGIDATFPYELTGTDVPAGTYVVTARAVDSFGDATTSSPVTIIINSPPSVQITSPPDGAIFTAPATITATVEASDPDGTIARVDFLAGGVLVGSDTTAPYSLTATGVGAGAYVVTARAVDDRGAAAISLPVTITVRAPAGPDKILLFSRTLGFRHDSIPAAIAAIRQLGVEHNFAVDATEDAAAFTDANLRQYRAVVFLLTTSDVLNDGQQGAFERYIRAGNGYVGVHSASDTEYDWPWYGELVGAYFESHPEIQTATVRIEDPTHPSTSPLPNPWVRRDEWYNFRTNPRGRVNVLANLDEASYGGGTMGDHPIMWYRAYDGGRSWYTAGGHTAESYAEPLFLRHLLGGIQYSAGLAAAP